MCEDILQNIPLTAVVIFSDEGHFHLAGTVNKQNFWYWAEGKPRELHQRPLHSPHVTVWCGVAEFGAVSYTHLDVYKRQQLEDGYIGETVGELSFSKCFAMLVFLKVYSVLLWTRRGFLTIHRIIHRNRILKRLNYLFICLHFSSGTTFILFSARHSTGYCPSLLHTADCEASAFFLCVIRSSLTLKSFIPTMSIFHYT